MAAGQENFLSIFKRTFRRISVIQIRHKSLLFVRLHFIFSLITDHNLLKYYTEIKVIPQSGMDKQKNQLTLDFKDQNMAFRSC